MNTIPDHVKITREEVRKQEVYKDLTDDQADELINLVVVLSECLYHQFGKKEKTDDTRPSEK